MHLKMEFDSGVGPTCFLLACFTSHGRMYTSSTFSLNYSFTIKCFISFMWQQIPVKWLMRNESLISWNFSFPLTILFRQQWQKELGVKWFCNWLKGTIYILICRKWGEGLVFALILKLIPCLPQHTKSPFFSF